MYHFQVGDFLWYLWCPDDRTIVTSLRSKDMPTEPFAPAAGESYAAHFEPTVRKCLQDDMSEGTQAWIVGSTETLDATFSAMPFLQIPSELRKSLKDVQAFAGWMQLDGKAAWHVTIDCAGLEATDSLSGYLNRLGLERGKDLHLFGNRATTAQSRVAVVALASAQARGNTHRADGGIQPRKYLGSTLQPASLKKLSPEAREENQKRRKSAALHRSHFWSAALFRRFCFLNFARP